MKQSELIEKLIKISEDLNREAEAIAQLPVEKLRQRAKEKSWNALECFAHVNLYIDIYNEFFENALRKSKSIKEDKEIKRGYWGNRFIQWMDPNVDSMQKMNTFKSKNTLGLDVDIKEIQHFIEANKQTINHLLNAKDKNIQNTKCQLALPLLKIKLSDAFHFLIAHNQRHMLQIKRAIN